MTPASIRNRNPGAMEPGPSSRAFGSTTHEVLRWRGPDGKPKQNRIATFATDQHGAAAMFDLLARRYTGRPLRTAVATWCGGYWAGDYAASVEAACGLKGDDALTAEAVRNPRTAIPIAKAMARVEAGRDYPLDQEGWETAHAMAFGDAMAPPPTPTNDVPFPKPEAVEREWWAAARLKSLWASLAALFGGTGWQVAQNGVPAPPQAITDSVSNVGAWKNVAGTVWADPLLIFAALGLAAIWGVPWIVGKIRGDA